MNLQNPIFTEKRECQDCYKCLRRCPVKAIKVEGGTAAVIPERCILCGQCVQACPNGAKRVRDDLPRAKQLITLGKRVIASLAPSWMAEFPGVSDAAMVSALRKLGFWAVSETALGAEVVSAKVRQLLRSNPAQTCLSSACPAAVRFLTIHHPEEAELLTDLLSPLLAHARILHEEFGPDCSIVFLGPCIAKKAEADAFPALVDAALTFEDLGRWFAEKGIDLEAGEASDGFVPYRAREGNLYPIEGGMIGGIREDCSVHDATLMSLSGIDQIESGLLGIRGQLTESPVFVELLACRGGCIGGPKMSHDEGLVRKRQRVIRRSLPKADTARPEPDITFRWHERGPAGQAADEPAEDRIRDVLLSLGKVTPSDEANCGGCGYESCRQLARALLDSRAERSMCVTYMRKLALKKANALITKMPSAVVIVNSHLEVVECNDIFVRTFVGDDFTLGTPGLEGAQLKRLLKFANLFQGVLKTGEDLIDREIRHRNVVLHGSIFTIERHHVVGGIFQDVTKPSVQKEQIVRKAREVIQKNLSTVQRIAYLLGENAAESEIILDSIIDSFSPPPDCEELHEDRSPVSNRKRPY